MMPTMKQKELIQKQSNYNLFLGIVLIWFLLLFIIPYLNSIGIFESVSKPIFFLYKIFCHQIPERSFFIFNQQMPVCQRCFAIYLGLVIGTLISHFISDKQSEKFPKIKWLILAGLIVGIDALTQLIGLRESTITIRLITGFIAGFVGTFYLLPAFNKTINSIKRHFNIKTD
jgi:uncharacterized membrane protein